MNNDQLQNDLILLKHHILDAKEGLNNLIGNKAVSEASLKDAIELIEKISKSLPEELKQEVLATNENHKKFKEYFST